MENLSDTELAVLAAKNNQPALEILIRRYLKPAYSFIYHYLNNPVEAEDAVQEVFIKLWKNLKKYNPQQSFKSWFFSIAKNTAIDFLRKKKMLTFSDWADSADELSPINTLADPLPLPDELLAKSDLTQTLSSALTKLSFKYRLVLLLHYQEQLTFQEIAACLAEPLDTVKSRHRRALIILRKLLL